MQDNSKRSRHRLGPAPQRQQRGVAKSNVAERTVLV